MMSQLLRAEPGYQTNEVRMPLSGQMANHLVRAISDEFSKRILVSTISEGKTVHEISTEQAVPLSSCYRRARQLVRQGLLIVERIVLTPEGRRFAVYRNSFREIEMTSDFGEVSVSAVLNGVVADKFRGMWFSANPPS